MNKNLLAPKKSRKLTYTLTIIFTLIVLTALGYSLFMSILGALNDFFKDNEIVRNKIIEVKFNKPFDIVKKEPQIVEKIFEYPGEIDTPIKEYICEKFGMYDCKTALAIVQAESGFNDQAINSNTNGSTDLGCWQINFPTHIKTISPVDALDCYKATDWAYEKYQRDGNFNAWVAFTNGAYLSNL